MCNAERQTDVQVVRQISAVLFGDGKYSLTLSLLCQLLSPVPLSFCQQYHMDVTGGNPLSVCHTPLFLFKFHIKMFPSPPSFLVLIFKISNLLLFSTKPNFLSL